MGDGRQLPAGHRNGYWQIPLRHQLLADAGFSWSIDPVNLPFFPDTEFLAPRYGGLHDVLRDAAPDGWGKLLLHREHGLPVTRMNRAF